MLDARHEGISPTLRDDRLREEMKTLEQKYMQKRNSQVVTVLYHFRMVYGVYGARGIIVVKTLGYKPEGHWFET
jgi:hypothetical protein